MALPQDQKKALLDKEIKIVIKPRPLLKTVVLAFLLIAVFFAGRLTAPDGNATENTLATEGTLSMQETAVSETGDADQEETAPAEQKAKKTKKDSSFSLTGFITGLFSSDDEKESQTDATVENATQNNTESNSDINATNTQENAENTTTAAQNAATEEPEEEIIITSYSRVAIALNDAIIEWRGTWGKITKIDYTIKNSEEGTIKPAYFIMHVEGYDDYQKKIPLPNSAKTVKAGKSSALIIAVPQGFAYNEITAGDLSNVIITLTLYDENDKLMSTYQREADLRSSS